MLYDSTKNDVKQLAEKIELLAKEVQNKLAAGDDCLSLATELVRNNSTFVFALGEMCALEHIGANKKSKALGRFSSVWYVEKYCYTQVTFSIACNDYYYIYWCTNIILCSCDCIFSVICYSFC